MFIQTEVTPNPATLKFLPGQTVVPQGSVEYRDPAAAARSPLAQALFAIDGVVAVYLGLDFITITKREDKDWLLLKPPVLGVIMDHFTSGRAAVEGDVDAAHEQGDDSEVVAQIKELLDTRIRPVVAQDGGDITFHRFEDGVVYLSMKGACAGCPSSTATLKSGIENMLRHYIPDVQEVRSA